MFGSSPFRSIFGHAESTHVNRPKGKALLALKRNRNNWICDKYAQPVGLNEKNGLEHGCQLLGYVFRAVRASVSYNDAQKDNSRS